MRFTRIRTYTERLLFDARSLTEIVSQLRGAGFLNIEIRIPEKTYQNVKGRVFVPEDFIQLNYNFVAQILTAKSATETVKILFVNHGKTKTIFDDRVFPSGHSISPSFYLETTDPVRLIGLEDFVRTLLRKNSLRTINVAQLQVAFFSVCTLVFAILGAIAGGAIQAKDYPQFFTEYPLLVTAGVVLCVAYFFYHIVHPGGLYVAPFEHPLISFSRRLSAGDLRNNLIVVVIIWILKVVVGGVLIGVTVNILSEILQPSVSTYIGLPKI